MPLSDSKSSPSSPQRRGFLQTITAAAVGGALAIKATAAPTNRPRLGIVVGVSGKETPDAAIARVHRFGLPTCQVSVGEAPASLAAPLKAALDKYGVEATAAMTLGGGPMVWDFYHGPKTIGLVPRSTRAARIAALKRASDLAKQCGIGAVHTHCGFIPEDPADALYPGTVEAIHTITKHCQGNGQQFLMETGQETPTTMSRMIRDVALPNIGVGLDTANLILYGKANPVDAVDILGPHIRSIHAKDGRWPTDPSELGEEVQIGKGLVDFKTVFTKLHRLGYSGAVTIERETSGPQQIEDVRQEKVYLERILQDVLA